MNYFFGCSLIAYQGKKVLVAQRSEIKKAGPLLWETIGGRLEEDETPEQCIRRETMEEIGCEILNLKLFDVRNTLDGDNRHIGIVFTGELAGEIRPNCEIAQTRWIGKEELRGYDFFPGCKDKLLSFFEREQYT